MMTLKLHQIKHSLLGDDAVRKVYHKGNDTSEMIC